MDAPRCSVLRRLVACLLALHLMGCATWRPAPTSVLTTPDPGPVRITTTEGRLVVVDEPRIQEGSIVGLTEQCSATRGAELRSDCEMGVAYIAPLTDVSSVEVRETDLTRTAIFVGVGVLTLSWFAGVFSGFIVD